MAKTKVLFDKTDEWGSYVTGWRITEGTKYITCVYLTNWPRDRCDYYRILKEDFTTIGQMIDDVWNERIPLYKRSRPIQKIN